jgi:hypothetical protein
VHGGDPFALADPLTRLDRHFKAYVGENVIACLSAAAAEFDDCLAQRPRLDLQHRAVASRQHLALNGRPGQASRMFDNTGIAALCRNHLRQQFDGST